MPDRTRSWDRILLRRVVALLVVLAPLLTAAWFGLCPQYGNPGCPGGPSPISAYRSAPDLLLQAFLFVNLIVPYVYPLSYLGLGWVALTRAPLLATLGMASGWIGSIPFGYFADQSGLLAAMARLQYDQAYTALIGEYMHDPHLLAVSTGWVIGHLVAYVLLGIALLRSGVTPRWSGALLIVAALVMGPLAYGTGSNVLQVGGFIAVAVASIPAGARLWLGENLDSNPSQSRP